MWKKINCFSVEKSETIPGKYILTVEHEKFFLGFTTGSFNIIYARILGMSYATFLRYCRDVYDADIYGKGSLYPVPYFNNKEKVKILADLLNVCANTILWERANPKANEHLIEMEKRKCL